MAQPGEDAGEGKNTAEMPGKVNENGPQTTGIVRGPFAVQPTERVAAVGFEPTTSSLIDCYFSLIF
jgi:hypothetical protein